MVKTYLSKTNKAVFLDRDGVINFDYGYIGTIDRFKIIPGVMEALQTFQSYNYLLIIITNQSGIGRKYYSIKDFELLNNHMKKIFSDKNVFIKDIFFEERDTRGFNTPHAQSVLALFDELEYDLNDVRQGKPVKPVFFTQLPRGINENEITHDSAHPASSINVDMVLDKINNFL